jgi:hypothetical protein
VDAQLGEEVNCAVAPPIIHLTARKRSAELFTWLPDASITSSMKDSTSRSHRESSTSPEYEVSVSCLRLAVSSAACSMMMNSANSSMLLCHEFDTDMQEFMVKPVARMVRSTAGRLDSPRALLWHWYLQRSHDHVAAYE